MEKDQDLEKFNNIIKVLWGAMVVGPLMLWAIGNFIIFPSVKNTTEPEMIYVYGFMGAAVVFALISKVLFIKAGDKKATKEQLGKNFTFLISAWASAEFISILGIVFVLICGTKIMEISHSFFAASVILNFVHKPHQYLLVQNASISTQERE